MGDNVVLVDQPTAAPTNKLSASTGAGAATAVLAWVVSLTTGLDIPAEVAIAISTLISLVAGYLVKDREV